VNRLTKVLLTSVAALLTVVILLLVGLNLYIQSPGTQARLAEGLSQALRMPVRFITTSVSPAGRLRISGITVPDGDRNFLEAREFTARFRPTALLRRRLEISQMTLERPRIVWKQNAKGHWVVPQALAASAPASRSAPSLAGLTTPAAKKSAGLEVVVESFQIRDGSAELLNKENNTVANLLGVTITYSTLTAERMAGTVQVASATWMDPDRPERQLRFENVRTPFTYAGQEVALPTLAATLAAGGVSGSFKLKLDGAKAPFSLALEFRDVQAGALSTQIESALGEASGAIDGSLTLAGSSREIVRAEGAGRLHIRDGRFQRLELFEAIGEVLQIKELSDLKLNDGHTDFRISEQRAWIDELSLEAANLRLSAKGHVKFEGKIQLNSQLSIDESLRKHLPGLLRGNFDAVGEKRYAIEFDITGKDFRPKTNLLDKVVGKKITSQFDDLVSSLFGSRKKEEKKDDKKKDDKKKDEKKKDGNAPAPPAPAPATPPPLPPAPTPVLAEPAENP
jgi:uncharacterized protein involved in outer membrane biogenesis